MSAVRCGFHWDLPLSKRPNASIRIRTNTARRKKPQHARQVIVFLFVAAPPSARRRRPPRWMTAAGFFFGFPAPPARNPDEAQGAERSMKLRIAENFILHIIFHLYGGARTVLALHSIDEALSGLRRVAIETIRHPHLPTRSLQMNFSES
ncbi:hypothetical protein B0H13DRAFT_2370106 [Mycena leptocephala]|nr:hypothetical protein B0H13DRAFT_2370106 [Mycena leptocephala]